MEEMVMEGNLELKEVQILEGHTDRVWGLAWNPTTGVDGIPPMLASCGGDKTVRIWQQEASSGNWDCKVLEDIHTRTVRNCSWSQSGKFLASSSFDATTGVWENFGDNFECISTLEGHENEVKCVAWNSSGSLLATCSRDKSIWIWEVQPGNEFDCVSVLQGHTQDIKMVQWHPSLDILVSVSYDNSIKVWEEDDDNDDWHCVQTLGESKCGHSSTVWGISFNSTGGRMATCSDDNTIKIWNTSTESTQAGPNGLGSWVLPQNVCLPSIKPVFLNQGLIEVFEGFVLREHVSTLSGYHSRTVFSVDWSRDGIIASGGADDAICLFAKSAESLVDGPSYELVLKKEKAHDMDVNAVKWNPTVPRLLASASDDGTVKIWQLVQVYKCTQP